MKCCLSQLADDTRVGAVVDIFEGKGCLIQWNPDKLDIRNNKSQRSTWTCTKSFTCSGLILYISISKCRRATLLFSSTWGGLRKDCLEVHIKKTWGSRHTAARKVLLGHMKEKRMKANRNWKWNRFTRKTVEDPSLEMRRTWLTRPWRAWQNFEITLSDLEVGLYYLLSFLPV